MVLQEQSQMKTKANTWAYTTRKTVNRHANSYIESCGAVVTDLNIQLERQKLDQMDVRELLEDVQLPCNAAAVSDVACEH